MTDDKLDTVRYADRQNIIKLMCICADHFEEEMRTVSVRLDGKEMDGYDFAGVLLLSVDGLLRYDPEYLHG